MSNVMLQYFVMALLLVMLILFAVSKLRYDLVALVGLSAVTLAGAVDSTEAFAGFGHPAVITVAAVLIISRGLLNSGLVDRIVELVFWVGDNVLAQIAVLTTLVAVCSAFINNVGALALFMPIALPLSASSDTPASLLLMPLAFGSLLDGLTTLVGTTFLSDLANNAATTVLVAPIALRVASGIGVSPDPLLMAVAIGAYCAFLTPIGHQSNTLIMGPGGHRFGDYWRMRLPLEVIIVLIGTPALLLIWSLDI